MDDLSDDMRRFLRARPDFIDVVQSILTHDEQCMHEKWFARITREWTKKKTCDCNEFEAFRENRFLCRQCEGKDPTLIQNVHPFVNSSVESKYDWAEIRKALGRG